ncbi:MAG: hypothetical protein Q9188_005373 [Gyalolechia gomerana]
MLFWLSLSSLRKLTKIAEKPDLYKHVKRLVINPLRHVGTKNLLQYVSAINPLLTNDSFSVNSSRLDVIQYTQALNSYNIVQDCLDTELEDQHILSRTFEQFPHHLEFVKIMLSSRIQDFHIRDQVHLSEDNEHEILDACPFATLFPNLTNSSIRHVSFAVLEEAFPLPTRADRSVFNLALPHGDYARAKVWKKDFDPGNCVCPVSGIMRRAILLEMLA